MSSKNLASVIKEKEAFLRMASHDKERHIFKSGILALDRLVSRNGGIPGGVLMQLIGNPKCGKSTLALDYVAQAQKSGIKEIEISLGKTTQRVNAVYVDFERSFDPAYAYMLGVDLDKLLLIEADWAEESFITLEALIQEGIQCVVIDSISMFVPESESDKTLSDNEKMASSASILTRVIKRLIPLADNNNTLVILINQYRANISTMARKESKPFGARIIQYGVKLTIDLTRIKNEEDKTLVRAYIEKTKLGGREGQSAEFDIIFGKGPDYVNHTLKLAEEYEIIVKRGTWYYYTDDSGKELKAQGIENAKSFPIEEITEKVKRKLYAN